MNELYEETRMEIVAPDPAAQQLNQEASMVEVQAASLTVRSDSEYAAAGDLAKMVKQMQKKIKDYWEPLRVSAKAAYDDILAHKKEMLDPLEKAEKIIKEKMSTYSVEKEKARKKQEEAMRLLALQEMEKKIEEAAKAEAVGDMVGVENAMAEAEVMEDVSIGGSIPTQAPKAAGVSQTKTWRITGIDSAQVPITFGGVEIRPVDEKAVLRLIKEAKGNIQIPGIQFEETVSISIRS